VPNSGGPDYAILPRDYGFSEPLTNGVMTVESFDLASTLNLVQSLDNELNSGAEVQTIGTLLKVAEQSNPITGLPGLVDDFASLFSRPAPPPPLPSPPQNPADWNLLAEQGRQRIAAGTAQLIQASPQPDPRVATLAQEKAQQIATVNPSERIVIGIGLIGEFSVNFLSRSGFLSGSIAGGFYIPYGGKVGFYTSLGGSVFSIGSSPITGIIALEITVIWGGLGVFSGTSYSVGGYAGVDPYAGGAALIFSTQSLWPVGVSIFGGAGTPSVTAGVQIAHTWISGASDPPQGG
jgi:hypothetical protein